MARDTLRDEWESARDADLFIYSRAAIGADHIAEKLGVPALAAFPTPLYSPTREFPSPFFPFRELGPLNKGSHRLFARMGPALYRRPINEWRRDVLGMPPARGEEWLNGRPVTTLYAYSEAVVPRPDDWDESSVITGYWFLDAPAGWQPDPALVSFIENGPPPVYLGFGSMSMFGAAATTDAILEAITLAGQRAVLTNGESMPAADLLPGEVFVAGAVPHDWLFPRMAAVVHHGGAGTTGAALRAGKPTVICPFVGDQAFWGRRVAALGVGPSPVPFRKLTAGLLAGAIQRAVTDVEMQRQAASLGETIRAEDGIGRAVAVIANQLSTG
jgi:UDP:flavonoid glycosyltransferase YjiC (YdhE family)